VEHVSKNNSQLCWCQCWAHGIRHCRCRCSFYRLAKVSSFAVVDESFSAHGRLLLIGSLPCVVVVVVVVVDVETTTNVGGIVASDLLFNLAGGGW